MTLRSWPLVGRESLRASILDRLAEGTNVVITGTAGLGKTTLASGVAERYPGTRHHIVGSPAATALPLAPVASLVGEATGNAAIVAARASLGLQADGRPDAAANPPLLVVDDIVALDDASVTVLHQLLSGGETRLLATLRTGVPSSAAVERLRRSLNTIEVAVDPLADHEILAMTEAALGAPLAGRARKRLVTSAEGNPMYARELVEGSLGAGILVRQGGAYDFLGEPVATMRLEELVQARLAPLASDQHRALEYLAVGGALPLAVLGELVASEQLEALERAGLIVARPGQAGMAIDVGHPLYRDMTRARLGALSRMRIHRELADAIERAVPAHRRSADDHLRHVTWATRSGARVDADSALAAARRALATGDTELGAELAFHAAEDASHTGAAIFAAHCASITGRHEQAVSLLRQARTRLDEPWARTAVLIKLAEEVWGTGDLDAGAEALAEASALGGETQALVDAHRAVHLVLGGGVGPGLALARPLLTHEHPGVRYGASVAATTALIFTDLADEAIEIASAYLRSPGESDIALVGDPGMPPALLVMAQLVAGDIAEASEAARQRFELAALEASAQSHAWASMLVGLASEASGDLDWAARALADGERGWVELGIWGSSLWCGSLLVRTLAQRGDVVGARAALERVASYPFMPGYIGNRFLPFARAWVLTLEGDRDAAAAALSEVLADARRTGQWTGWHEAWHEAARLSLLDLVTAPDALPTSPDATPPAPRGRLSRARGTFVDGVRTADPTLLADAAEQFRVCGALLYAAEAAAASEKIAARSGGATASRERANAGRASERLSAVLRAEVPAANTPLLAGARRPGTGPLSPREREIAEFAGDGISNRAIADRLVVSERTVENHLYRVFIKLGLTGRDQLRSALSDLGRPDG